MYDFSHEHVPNILLNSKIVWTALLPKLASVALLRNLNKMSVVDLFSDNTALELVVQKLQAIENINPMVILTAYYTYIRGKGIQGALTWPVEPTITKELEKCFYKSFDSIPVLQDKRICVAIDISGSMTSIIQSSVLTSMQVALVMALQLLKSNIDIIGFSHILVKLPLSLELSIQQNLDILESHDFGVTDISLPFIWAESNNEMYDAFVVLTDCETNSNKIKPIDALRNYRKYTNNKNCKLVVWASTSTSFSIADPNDVNMLDICGISADIPNTILSFINNDLF